MEIGTFPRDCTSRGRRLSRRRHYSSVDISSLLHPAGDHKGKSSNVEAGSEQQQSSKKVSKDSKHQNEKFIQDLISHTSSRVDQIRKVFEEKSKNGLGTFKPIGKKLVRSRRRHTVSGISFKQEQRSESSSEDEIISQVFGLLGQQKHVGGITENQSNADYIKNMEPIQFNMAKSNDRMLDSAMASAAVTASNSFPDDQFNLLGSIPNYNSQNGLRADNDGFSRTVSTRRSRKNRASYIESCNFNSKDRFKSTQGGETHTTHLSIMTSPNDAFGSRSVVDEKNNHVNVKDTSTIDTNYQKLTKISFDQSEGAENSFKAGTGSNIFNVKETMSVTVLEDSFSPQEDEASNNNLLEQELPSSSDDDTCLKFYGRYEKSDFETKLDSDKYSTFLDLSNIQCVPSSGLPTLEEEEDSYSVSEKSTSGDTDMGSSIGKTHSNKKNNEAKTKNSGKYQNDLVVIDITSSEESPQANSTETSTTHFDNIRLSKAMRSPDDSLYGITSELSEIDIKTPNDDNTNCETASTAPSYKSAHRNFDTSKSEACANKSLDVNSNFYDSKCQDKSKKSTEYDTEENKIETPFTATSVTTAQTTQVAASGSRRRENLFKRRNRSFRRVSDPTGINNEHVKMFVSEANSEGCYENNGMKRLYEIVQLTKSPGSDVTRIRDIYKILESKGIRKSDPRLRMMNLILKGEKDGDNTVLTEYLFTKICEENFDLIRNVLLGQITIPGYEYFKKRMEKIYEALKKCLKTCSNDTYIESKQYSDSSSYLSVMMQRKSMLDKTDTTSMSVCTVDGQRISFGDTDGLYTLSACANVFNYSLACSLNGSETVHWYIGRSSKPADKPLQEYSFDSKGRVWNPLTKAGAIMTSSLLIHKDGSEDHSSVLHEFYRRLTGNEVLCCDNLSYNLKRMFGHEEISIAYFLSAQKKLPTFAVSSPGDALEISFQSSCTATTCDSCSVAAATYAGLGVCPLTGDQAIPEKVARHTIKTIQLSSEDFCRRSGMAVTWSELGSIMVIIPGVMGITFSTQCQYTSTMRQLVTTLVENLSTEFNFALYRSLQDTRKKVKNINKDNNNN